MSWNVLQAQENRPGMYFCLAYYAHGILCSCSHNKHGILMFSLRLLRHSSFFIVKLEVFSIIKRQAPKKRKRVKSMVKERATYKHGSCCIAGMLCDGCSFVYLEKLSMQRCSMTLFFLWHVFQQNTNLLASKHTPSFHFTRNFMHLSASTSALIYDRHHHHQYLKRSIRI